ncbi:hypothetical protein D9M68_623270 [compost metagenome]
MALIDCYECGKQISSVAKACPNCGAPSRDQSEQRAEAIANQRPALEKKKVGFWLVLGIVFFPFIFFWPMLTKNYSVNAKTAALIWLVFYIGPWVIPNLPEGTTNHASMTPAKTPELSPREKVMSNLSLASEEAVDKFGVMTANFTIKNDSEFMIKDVRVKCVNFSKTNTELDTNTRTIYEALYSWETKEIKDFNMGLVHSQRAYSECKIIDFEVM